MKAQIKTALLLLVPALSLAQVPVDDDGNVIGTYQSQADVMSITDYGVPLMSHADLQELVGPIALYPDDLLAIVLPASAYPLQIVEAARFLEALESNSSLEPDPDWDDSIVALINYPEVVDLLNDDLDWTLRLGEAVVAQQTDVVAAVEAFRDRAYAAGNLESDAYQTVSREDDVIRISPITEDVIYVPYYEPAQVVYYQPRPVYYYHPRAYPVYYYPYSAGHHFNHGYFWGVTTAFTIGWLSDSLHVYHHSYHGHPYYGRTYWNDGWYRRPSIHVYNSTYVNHGNGHINVNRHSRGDQWRARDTQREYIRREGYSRATAQADRNEVSNELRRQARQREDISFRERDPQVASRARENQVRNTTARTTQARNSNRQTPRQDRVENTRETIRDARREQPTVATRNTSQRRERPVDRSGEITFRERNRSSGERTPTLTTQVPSRTDYTPTPATRTTTRPATRVERAPTRAERPAARTQRAPTRTERPATRSTQSPSRSQPVPSQQQPRRSEPSRQEQPARSREASGSAPSRSQPAERSSPRSEQRSSRSRDRKDR